MKTRVLVLLSVFLFGPGFLFSAAPGLAGTMPAKIENPSTISLAFFKRGKKKTKPHEHGGGGGGYSSEHGVGSSEHGGRGIEELNEEYQTNRAPAKGTGINDPDFQTPNNGKDVLTHEEITRDPLISSDSQQRAAAAKKHSDDLKKQREEQENR
jgi:hypothetical protein